MILYILYIHLQYAKIIKTFLGTRAQLKRNKLRTPLITNRSYRPVCEGMLLGSGTEDSNQGMVYTHRNECLHNYDLEN